MSDTVKTARVVGCLGGLYEVITEGGEHLFCTARGSFRHEDTRVLVGDVAVLDYASDGSAVIDDILDRKNSLIRPSIANLDHLTAVVAVKKPIPVAETLDKLLAICAHNRIETSIVLTKCDLGGAPVPEGDEMPLDEIYRRAGYPVFVLSSQTGEGVSEYGEFLRARLHNGETLAFAGASGVGKSTLLNHLFPELNCQTGGVSEKISRGKHTTRAVSLFPLEGGFLADTPGFSMLDFLRFDFFALEDLPLTFPEIAAKIGSCRYADCAHTREEGCAVLESIQKRELSASRHRSYCTLYDILRRKKRDIYK